LFLQWGKCLTSIKYKNNKFAHFVIVQESRIGVKNRLGRSLGGAKEVDLDEEAPRPRLTRPAKKSSCRNFLCLLVYIFYQHMNY
ncbi:hypothetical protein ACJX0J_010590, partial [Zea mays]